MKIALVSLVVAVALSATSADIEPYIDGYDFDALLANPEKWKDAVQCVLDLKECGDLQNLKEGSLRRLHSNCGSCNVQQRENYDRVMKKIAEKYPQDFIEIAKLIKKE